VTDNPKLIPDAALWTPLTKAPAALPPAQPVPAPTPQPAAPTPEEIQAQRNAEAAAKHRATAAGIQRRSRNWTVLFIVISAVITIFGSGNAHSVLHRHETPDPWGWFLYPALEAGLIVEIQIGAVLAEYEESVVFWGAALRAMTALAAITLCVYGPAEVHDPGGAILHAIGPTIQFFCAEFLAAARRRFKRAVEKVMALAEGRENAAKGIESPRTAVAKKRTKKQPSVPRPPADGRTKPTMAPPVPGLTGPDDHDLLVRARAAADELERTKERLNRDNLVRAIRAGGGTIQNKDAGRILDQIRAERGAPALTPVREKGA